MRLYNNLVLAGAALWIALAWLPAMAAEQPAAFCQFTTSGVSYNDSCDVQTLSELVQAELASISDLTWVERTNIDTALSELELTAFGQIDAASSMQLGQWLKADVLLKAALSRTSDSAWQAQIEIIDLHRADTLARQIIALDANTQGRVEVNAAAVEKISQAMRAVIPKALKTRAAFPRQVLIAPLYFRNAESTGRLDFLAEDLRRRFAERNLQQDRVHYLQFPRAESTVEEANLIVGGIVAADHAEWRHIADYYVWGAFREVESSGVAFPEVQVELTLEFWDGRGEVQRIVKTAKVKELPSLVDRTVEAVEDRATAKNRHKATDDIRKRIAEDLRIRAKDLQEWVVQTDIGDYGRLSEEWVRLWSQCIRILSIAAFFDPANEIARRELLIETTRTDFVGNRPSGAQEFWRVWNASKAWKAHCRQFGYDYKHVHAPKLKYRRGLADNRIMIGALWMYVDSAETILIAAAADKSYYREGYPPADVPEEILQKWLESLSRDYINRIKFAIGHNRELIEGRWSRIWHACQRYIPKGELRAEAIQASWPCLMRSERFKIDERDGRRIRETFTAIGKPEIADQLLAEAQRFGHVREAKSPPPASQPRRTASRRVETSPPQVPKLASMAQPPMETISLASAFYTNQVTALEYADGRLWIGVDGQFRNRGANQGCALLVCESSGANVRLVKRRNNSDSKIADALYDGRLLWLASDGDGVCRVDLEKDEWHQFTARDGLPSHKIFTLARWDNTLYVGGGQDQRGILASLQMDKNVWRQHELPGLTGREDKVPTSRVTRIACNAEWLAVYAQHYGVQTQVLLRRRTGGPWSHVGELLKRSHPQFSHFTNSWRLKVHGLLFADGWLWMATSRGLVAYNPDRAELSLVQPLPLELSAVWQDGRRLWFTAIPFSGTHDHGNETKNACLLQFDLATKSWTRQVPIPYSGKPIVCKQHGDTIWLGMGSKGSEIVAVDVEALRVP